MRQPGPRREATAQSGIVPALTGPIAIDARAAARPELGGVERWARELTVRLPALRPGGYSIVKPPPNLAHRAGHAWEQLVLPVRARRAAALLCPANLAPAVSRNTILVLHDAAALRHPRWYSRAYAEWQRRLLPVLVRRARRIVTVSAFSRDEVSELLHVDPARIDVVPGGVEERFRPDTDPGPARRALGLRRPYVLCVASLTARKNLAALASLAGRLDGLEVVAAGGHRPQFAPEEDLGELRLLGHVDDDLMPGLYAGAEAFVLPSLYEGFGLPVLEAMASGTPVVATRAGALPDTAGGAAALVDDPAELADAVTAALGDPTALIARGLERAEAFTWDRTARGIDAICASAAM